MNKIFLFFSTSIFIVANTLSVMAVPVIYYEQKGEYTVDLETGTYKGCVYDTGCIKLGRNRKIGISTWKKGDYTYSINDSKVQVYKKGKMIFQDTFN